MALNNAHIIGIGKSFQVMTQVHHVESLLAEEWPAPQLSLPNIPVTVVENKHETLMEVGGTQQLWNFNIWKLKQIIEGNALQEWRFHSCPMFAARAGDITDALVEAAKRGFTLYDP
jgi:hypothetical protein